MNQCEHCGTFFNPGQNSDMTQDGCPQCGRPYRDQPGGIPDESNDMLHGLQSLPTSTQDDMSGNPLQEGMLGGWKNRQVRDEAFASVRSKISLFEMPEFETTGLVAPPDLYRHALETEAAHRAHLQLPHGITDNLHAALGNLGAWAENPYENGGLRPYNEYWKVIRPSFAKPGSLQIGVSNPTMAEIINHVAQTDDLAPLYEYRGRQSHTKTAGPLVALAPEGIAALAEGASAAGGADALAAGGGAGLLGPGAGAAADATAAAGADVAGESASGVGGIMRRALNPVQNALNNPGVKTVRGLGQLGQGLNYVDDFLGAGTAPGAQGQGGGGSMPVQDASFYARTATDEDDAFPTVHGEIPKQEDGDYHQQDDGNQHEWQRDISVDEDGGGALHVPSFQHGGDALQRFMLMLPLLKQLIDGGQSGSEDPLIQGLHQSLESEIPGYLDHADDNAGDQLLMMLMPGDSESVPEEDHDDQAHTDENAGGKRESKVVGLEGEAAEFLPVFEVTPPSLNGFRTAVMMPPGPPMGPPMGGPGGPGGPGMGGPPPSPMSGPPAMPATPPASPPISQGPVTDEQQAWFANWLDEEGRGDEIPTMLQDPQLFAKEFALARHKEVPPQAVEDSLSAEPPMPAQEEAPPEDTMPVPGMANPSSQMTAAIERYAADSVAGKCPECGSHTTEILDDEGTSRCHGCQHEFKTEGKTPKKMNESRTAAPENGHDLYDPSSEHEAIEGVPAADQEKPRDIEKEQDSGHTWVDTDGAPLQVGHEYEMYSAKYDIPDLARIEAIRPDSITYTLTGEFGLEHSTELTHQEATIEGVTFEPSEQAGEIGPEDDGSFEENNDNNTPYTGSPERTDLSAPSGLVSASVRQAMNAREYRFLADIIARAPIQEREALAHHFADELMNTNPRFDRERFIQAAIGQPGGRDVRNLNRDYPPDNRPGDLTIPEEFPPGPDDPGATTFPEEWGRQASAKPNLSWLMAGMRTAGANYTSMEQRELIDERGEARNADLMDLLHTHYVTDADDDQFLFGL